MGYPSDPCSDLQSTRFPRGIYVAFSTTCWWIAYLLINQPIISSEIQYLTDVISFYRSLFTVWSDFHTALFRGEFSYGYNNVINASNRPSWPYHEGLAVKHTVGQHKSSLTRVYWSKICHVVDANILASLLASWHALAAVACPTDFKCCSDSVEDD